MISRCFRYNQLLRIEEYLGRRATYAGMPRQTIPPAELLTSAEGYQFPTTPMIMS